MPRARDNPCWGVRSGAGTTLSPKPLIVIKLGGSALTDKNRIYTPRMREINQAARQIARLRTKFSLVIIHGAGSFGHIPVKRWGLHSGFKNVRQLKGLSTTKLKLLEWEQILNQVFLKHQIPLVPALASDFIIAKNGRISSADVGAISRWLSLGCVPSIGGDIVTDLATGFSVVSGDQIAAYLARRLHATRLIFGTDIDGIYDANPKLNPKAKLLTDLTLSSARHDMQNIGKSLAPDVTGGMGGKVSEALAAVSEGIPVHFINLTRNKRLTEVALGRKVLGSKISPS
jgi:isopentenyl phosphate kinase